MNEALLRSLIDVLVFLETADDDECDPDSAVKLMETIASHLSELSQSQKSKFAKFNTIILILTSNYQHFKINRLIICYDSKSIFNKEF